jgi:hypothetical protein
MHVYIALSRIIKLTPYIYVYMCVNNNNINNNNNTKARLYVNCNIIANLRYMRFKL